MRRTSRDGRRTEWESPREGRSQQHRSRRSGPSDRARVSGLPRSSGQTGGPDAHAGECRSTGAQNRFAASLQGRTSNVRRSISKLRAADDFNLRLTGDHEPPRVSRSTWAAVTSPEPADWNASREMAVGRDPGSLFRRPWTPVRRIAIARIAAESSVGDQRPGQGKPRGAAPAEWGLLAMAACGPPGASIVWCLMILLVLGVVVPTPVLHCRSVPCRDIDAEKSRSRKFPAAIARDPRLRSPTWPCPPTDTILVAQGMIEHFLSSFLR